MMLNPLESESKSLEIVMNTVTDEWMAYGLSDISTIKVLISNLNYFMVGLNFTQQPLHFSKVVYPQVYFLKIPTNLYYLHERTAVTLWISNTYEN